jgi:hypothetical protein
MREGSVGNIHEYRRAISGCTCHGTYHLPAHVDTQRCSFARTAQHKQAMHPSANDMFDNAF